MACLLTNVTLLPGSGSLIAGRWTGYLQMLLAFSGMMLTLALGGVYVKLLLRFGAFANRMSDFLPASQNAVASLFHEHARVFWGGLGGIGLFAVGWLWALVSGLLILNESGRKPPAVLGPDDTPPSE